MSPQPLSALRHELRNQLNTISVNAELIKLLASQPDNSDRILACAERILAECSACAELLTDSSNGNEETR